METTVMLKVLSDFRSILQHATALSIRTRIQMKHRTKESFTTWFLSTKTDTESDYGAKNLNLSILQSSSMCKWTSITINTMY